MAIDQRPTFNYAQRCGAFVEKTPEGEVICCRPDVSLSVIQEVRRALGNDAAIRCLEEHEYDETMQSVFASGSGDTLSSVGDSMMGLDEVAAAMEEPEDLLKSEEDAPVIKILNALFFEAIQQKASDVHIEPYERKLDIRFRLDGVLRTVLSPPPQLAPLLVSRVKVMANLDIAEKRIPQDGRISLRLGGRAVDLRVSTLPARGGERVVLRILDKSSEQPRLDQLGMAREMQDHFRSMVRQPHGIVLVTGPTGSGKSTTLYAALAEIDRAAKNVMTIEDPVEYNIPGISQTQVNLKAGMTFARGLRAILRQDPDVVLIGEIRDNETADIAVQASLTGHMVLSTLHTNTSLGAISRLCDMEVEPFLLISTLQGVLAQRLVRRLCPSCREPYPADVDELRRWGVAASFLPEGKDNVFYRAAGCDECRHTGYIGRFGLFDMVTLDDTLRQMIHDGANEMEMTQHVRKTQPSLREAGIVQVLKGETSMEEVLSATMS